MIRISALVAGVTFTVAASSVWADTFASKEALRSFGWEGTWSIDCSSEPTVKQVNTIPNLDELPYTELYARGKAFAREFIVNASWNAETGILTIKTTLDAYLLDLRIGEYTSVNSLEQIGNSVRIVDSEVSFTSSASLPIPALIIFPWISSEIQPGETVSAHAVVKGIQTNPITKAEVGPTKPLNRCF